MSSSVNLNTESQSPEGRVNVLKSLATAGSSISREVDLKCWQLYNNYIDIREFEYLTSIGGYSLPAKFQHIPAQRPKINFLVGKQLERPFQFSVSCVDKSSLKKKKEARVKFYVDEYMTRFRMMYNQVDSQLKEVMDKKAEIEQSMQQKPQNEDEQQKMIQAKKALPQIEAQIETIRQTLTDSQVFTMQNIKKLENLQRYTNKDYVEITAQKAMKAYIQRLDIKQKGVQNFISSVVTGKDYYYVDYRPGDPLPIYRSLQGHNVFYQGADDVNWVEDLDWCGFEENMTPQDVISEWGLEGNEKGSIEESNSTITSSGGNAGPFVMDTDGAVIDGGPYFVPSGSVNPSAGVNVKRVWWVAERVLNIVATKNKYRPGRTFYDFMSKDDKRTVIDKKDYRYEYARGENGQKISKWILRGDHKDKASIMESYNPDDVKVIDSKEGDEVLHRYIYDRYKGAIINNDIYKAQKDPIQPRSVDNYSKTKLPIIGPTYNNVTMQPYSMIWATKEIQRLINIVSWHKELMLALSGTKTLLYDMLFKPEGMSDKEYKYNMKSGSMPIQTKKKGVNQLQSSFNQWQVLDLSLSDSIQYLDKIIDNLDNQMGLIMGISRPAMGQTTQDSQVGTFQMSQQSTMLITEVIYAKHDEVERRALSMLMNIARQYLWDKETIMSYVDENSDEQIIDIPPGVLNLSDFEIILANNTVEERRLNELKSYALQNYSKGVLPFSDFSKIYSSDSMQEIKKMGEYFSEESQRLAQESQQRDDKHEMDLIQQKIGLQGEISKFVENQKAQIEQLKIEVDKQKLGLQQYISTNELKLKEKELADKENLGQTKVAGDLEGIKMASEVKQESNRNKEQIALLKIKLDHLAKMLEPKKETANA